MDLMIAGIVAWLVVVVLALAMFAGWAIGWLMGRRLRARDGERSSTKFDDASLALMGLLLAFTFGMSLNKHDNRRDMVVADSNAIGDLYNCITVLKEPVRGKLQNALRDYVDLRAKVARTYSTPADLQAALPRFEQMQTRIVELVAQAENDGTPIAVPLMNTLNQLTSVHAARLAAIRDRLPASIVMLLFVAAIVSTLLVGREQGIAGRPEIAGTLAFILLVTCAVYVTLDLNQPQTGMVTVSQEPIERLLSSITK
jgi:hypothetical protein